MDFAFVTLVGVISDKKIKLHKRLDKFTKGSNWYLYWIIDIFGWKVLTAGIIKSEEKMECLLGRLFTAKECNVPCVCVFRVSTLYGAIFNTAIK